MTLLELLEEAKGRTWITGRSLRMGEGLCIRITEQDRQFLVDALNYWEAMAPHPK